MFVDCIGMFRSGSTLQYNIVSEILLLKQQGEKIGFIESPALNTLIEDKSIYKIFKNHFLTQEISNALEKNENSTLLYTYRDIRDVCVSIMDKEQKSFEDVYESGVLHVAIEQYDKVMSSSIKRYSQSYELMFKNLKREIREIANYFNIKLTIDEIKGIYNKISMKAQKKNIKHYIENSDYINVGGEKFNSDTLLHLNHIKDGSIGKYKERLTTKQIYKLEEEFGEWLTLNNYPLECNKNYAEPMLGYYSQHGEDYFLSKFFNFKNKGFYIDVGAFDGVHLSNTYTFEIQGWNGVCIEPGQYFENCKMNRPNAININAACVASSKVKEIEFNREALGLFSTVKQIDSNKNKYFEDVYNARELSFSGVNVEKVKAVTLDEVLKNNSIKEVDFISIDVEGAELDVLKGFDLGLYAPRVIVIEANDKNHENEIIEYLTIKHNYIFARSVSVNKIFVRTTEDFYLANSIDITCSLEKQLHPLGEEYTDKEYIDGVRIVNGLNSDLLIKQQNESLRLKQDLLKNKYSELEQLQTDLSNKDSELEQLQTDLNQKKLKLTQILNGIENIAQKSIKTSPLAKYQAYKELVNLYTELSNNE